jgi:hypothetical protein
MSCLCFFLDPGGSREISLCPHSPIYPIKKLATPLGKEMCLCICVSGSNSRS